MKVGKKRGNIGDMKQPKVLSKQEQERRKTIIGLASALGLAILFFFAMILVQKTLIDQEGRLVTCTALQDIPEGTKLTSENIDKYVALTEIPSSLIPDGYYDNKEALLNKFITNGYKAKEIIVDNNVDSRESYISNIENPVEVSFNVASLDTAVSGILREGDIIDIYSVTTQKNSMGEEVVVSKKIIEGAYIEKAFDGSGARIEETGTNSGTTTLFNLIIPREDEASFYEAIAQGNIRLAKVLK